MDATVEQLIKLLPVIVGALLGFLSASMRDAVQNRRRTVAQILDTSRCFYAYPRPESVASNPELPAQWVRSLEGKEHDAALFFLLDVLVLNRSYMQDAIVAAWLAMPGGLPREEAELRPGRPFVGENVPEHSLTHLHLLFKFDGVNLRGFEGFYFDFKTEFRLNLDTIRGQTLTIPVAPAGFVPAWDPALAHTVDLESGVTTPATPPH